MDYEDNYLKIGKDNLVKSVNKKRGDILHYTISQVASLLEEDDSAIRYYTNLFDDILHIEIVNKQFRYTNNDVDKLEFLINLKNKGMSIKQIQEYCSELPLDEEKIEIDESHNSLSIQDLLNFITSEQEKNINALKEVLMKEIKDNISKEVSSITSSILKSQNDNFKDFKNDIHNDVSKTLSEKLNMSFEQNKELNESILLKSEELISEKLDSQNKYIFEKIENQNKEIINTVTNLNNEISEKVSTQNEDILNNVTEQTKNMLDTIMEQNNKILSELITQNEDVMKRIKSQNSKILDKLTYSFNEFNTASTYRDTNLLNEIKKFKDVIQQAYCVQHEVDLQISKQGFLKKLFGNR